MMLMNLDFFAQHPKIADTFNEIDLMPQIDFYLKQVLSMIRNAYCVLRNHVRVCEKNYYSG